MLTSYLFALCTSDLLSTADSPKPHGNRALQHTAFRYALRENFENTYRAAFIFEHYIRTPEFQIDDICTWRGVECDKDTIISFICTCVAYEQNSHGRIMWVGHRWYVDADWLPSTLRTLHFRQLHFVSAWRTDRLPRDLQFLCFDTCRLMAGADTPQPLNLQRLPSKMEYVYLKDGWLMGKVTLNCLPETMKVLCIKNNSLKKAFVDNLTLPEGLELIALEGKDNLMGKVKLFERSGKKVDGRVQLKLNTKCYVAAYCEHVRAMDAYYEEWGAMRWSEDPEVSFTFFMNMPLY